MDGNITIHQLLFSDVPNDGFSSDDPDINDAEDGDLESEHTDEDPDHC